jgi:hypothetical protein
MFLIWNMYYIRVPPIVSKTYHHPNFIILLDCSRLHIVVFPDILTWSLFWGPKKVVKSLLDIYRFNLSTDFVGVPKMHFGEVKLRFMPTFPIYIVWYIRIFFDILEVSKCVFIWNMIYIRVPPICFRSYLHPNFYQLTRLYSVRCLFFIWYIKMVLILSTQGAEKAYWKFPGLICQQILVVY